MPDLDGIEASRQIFNFLDTFVIQWKHVTSFGWLTAMARWRFSPNNIFGLSRTNI